MPDAYSNDGLYDTSVLYKALQAGHAGYGVISGLLVAAQGSPNMTVNVPSGSIDAANAVVASAGNASLAINAAHASLDRYDLVSVNNAGTVVYTAGTASATAVPPEIPATSAVLAVVYVAAAATQITNAGIYDLRITHKKPPQPRMFRASGPSIASSVGAGAEQTIFDLAATPFMVNKWYLQAKAITTSDENIIYFTVKLYKGSNVIWESNVLTDGTSIKGFNGDYNGTTMYSETYNLNLSYSKYTPITAAAQDMTAAGNIKLTIKNNNVDAVTPAATHLFFVEIYEDAS